MIPRYALPEMESIFADESRFGRWVEIELLATEAHSVLELCHQLTLQRVARLPP